MGHARQCPFSVTTAPVGHEVTLPSRLTVLVWAQFYNNRPTHPQPRLFVATAERPHGALVAHALSHAPGAPLDTAVGPLPCCAGSAHVPLRNLTSCVAARGLSHSVQRLFSPCRARPPVLTSAHLQVFASHAQFKDWFSNPLTGMVEGSAEVRASFCLGAAGRK